MASVDDLIRQDLAARPDGILEAVAEERDVPMQAVLDCLGPESAQRVPGTRFEEIWQDLTGWGEITFVVHTRDGVFECRGCVPPGTLGRGYFNIHGDSPIGGHLRLDRCRFVYFIDRPFFGKRSCSVQFVNEDGGVMFKVFVGRNEDRSLKEDQLVRFEALRERHR
ncbi:heme utilization cystosolic carrier protein HutX [Microvirga tunisiensis]|uniref:Heme utilization cystosolic carrier protein HutX n=1 Tax=Microvirga tunisiensis TaxID=2108360 RepID=A0A5N7MV09_9HYPH|nr:heme utilization cystosolic carrier protein HutX [Microvirga tunisiensis]MPR12593.1 heme utilization cystosolic carrier protein HutX [Microvirga tunisiensis]MPR30510.1 heme utilization cystosolic carrier protein HutX [Microvirga tunisiensis]